ncbi:hypothetical protein ACXHQ0_19485 [Vibrio antiquarius]|uniref:Uncharacterized protein n=2 Tax=Vibrio TaxID=662 RepID=A0A8H9TKJ5_VIBPH|nr:MULTISPECIES: hypothetical protein [Vibrio harveyi group]EGR3229336.1 hypothetical protein [Vibrio parahaemolyticus]EGR5927997.1 hypothetical protein [Vibrio parahaemolyticus]EJG0181403.1 hypothetical protein [Vibrio parahaemolyticus]MCS0314042.1 hypothetical protein [Vibrio diabolicus]UYV30421.1 hypothetical protein M5598_25775 [Vibrio parahaemolyticus]
MDNVMCRDSIRDRFKAIGIGRDNVTKEQLLLIHQLINSRMMASDLFDGTMRMTEPYNGELYLQCSTKQWDKREALSFNTDGFIGIAGWASDKSVKPILQGLCDFLDQIGMRPNSDTRS